MPAKAPKKAIVGEKVGMTQVWDESQRSVAVTVVRVTPVRVVQVKTPVVDGYSAVQVTYGSRRPSTINKPLTGHYAKARVDPGRRSGRTEGGRQFFVLDRPGARCRHLHRRGQGRRDRFQQGPRASPAASSATTSRARGPATVTTSTTGRRVR